MFRTPHRWAALPPKVPRWSFNPFCYIFSFHLFIPPRSPGPAFLSHLSSHFHNLSPFLPLLGRLWSGRSRKSHQYVFRRKAARDFSRPNVPGSHRGAASRWQQGGCGGLWLWRLHTTETQTLKRRCWEFDACQVIWRKFGNWEIWLLRRNTFSLPHDPVCEGSDTAGSDGFRIITLFSSIVYTVRIRKLALWVVKLSSTRFFTSRGKSLGVNKDTCTDLNRSFFCLI